MELKLYGETFKREFSIGTNSNRMLRLVDMDILPPDTFIYKPYAVSYVRGDLSRVGDGEASIEWIWDVSSIREVSGVLTFLMNPETEEYKHNVFVRSYAQVGQVANPLLGFKTFQATVYRPELFGNEGSMIVRSFEAYQTVKITFTNLVEL